MDRNERMNSDLVALRTALRGWQADIWTALPAIVVSYNAEKQTAEVQPTVQAQIQDKTGKWTDVTLPVCPDVPVCFPGGGGFSLTFPIAAGDEGIVIFASRCIDAFWQSGGVQPQAEVRMHDLSDGMFIPGNLSQAKKLSSVSTDSVQLRAADGTSFVEMKAGGIVNILAPGGFNVVGPATITEGLELGGELTGTDGVTYAHDFRTTGDVIAKVDTGSVALSTHSHTQGNDGHGDAEQPTNSPTPGS